MIGCRHTRQLLDRYLDGELSSSLEAELHAHQLACPECQSELALQTAFGDVIAGDRAEPTLSASFTDRVLSAHRPQPMIVPRRWNRWALFAGLPAAAAASVVLAVVLTLPSKVPVIAGLQVAVPKNVQERISTREQSPAAQAELDATPQMPVSMAGVMDMDRWLSPLVQRAHDTVEGARRGAAQWELLLRVGLSDPTEKLAAKCRPTERDPASGDAPAGPVGIEPDPSDPESFLNSEPSGDSKPNEIPEAI